MSKGGSPRWSSSPLICRICSISAPRCRVWRKTTSNSRSASSSSRCSPRSSATSTPRRPISNDVLGISESVEAVSSGAKEIATASEDLSHRTEEQAASLEETSGALNTVTETVKKTADGSARARTVVGETRAQRRKSRRRGAQRGRGDGAHREVVAADQPDHRRDRRDRVPNQSARVECGRRSGARGRCGQGVRGRRLRSARARPALRRGRQRDQGPHRVFDRTR